MSIYGISNSNVSRPAVAIPTRDPQVGNARRTDVLRPSQPANPAAATAATPATLPAEAPPGTDPALWSVLSNEERGYFAKLGAMGPLTYGRALEDIRANQVPSVRGGRLDVKV
jgi:hypothetical protein